MKPVTLLIADDHPVVREGLAKMIALHADLRLIGEARDGEEAVQKVGLLKPNVVLMDVRMAGLNGVEATRQIRAQFPLTEVIVLSNYDEDRYIFEALRAGAKSYLLKDVSVDRLADAIRRVARGEATLDSALVGRVVGELQHLQRRANNPRSGSPAANWKCCSAS